MTCPRSHSELVATARLEARAPECQGQRPALQDPVALCPELGQGQVCTLGSPGGQGSCCREHRQAHTHKQKPAGSFSVPPDSNTPVLEQTEIRLKSGKPRATAVGLSPLMRWGFESLLHFPLGTRSAIASRASENMSSRCLESFTHSCPSYASGDPGAGGAPGAEGEGHWEERDKISVLKGFDVREETIRHDLNSTDIFAEYL